MGYPNNSPLTFTQGPGYVDEILATTMSLYHPTLVDNIYIAIPTLSFLKKKGKKTSKGVSGVSIIIPVKFRKNTTAKMYSDDDVLDITRQQNYTTAQYLWKQLAVTVVVTGLEATMNSGDQAIIDLVSERLKDAELSGAEKLSTQLFNASAGSKDLIPLGTLVDATSSVGDINSSSYSWWQAQAVTSGSFAAQGISDWRNGYNLCCQYSETDIPTFAVTTQTVHQYYEGVLQPQERFMSTDKADAGFMKLQFKGIPIVWDPSATSGTLWFLNDNHIELRVASGKDFAAGKWIEPDNADTRVCKMLWYGALLCNERRKNCKISSISA